MTTSGVLATTLNDLTSRFGKVARLDIKRGYAFVLYTTEESADDCVRSLDCYRLAGSELVVERSLGASPRMPACWSDVQCVLIGVVFFSFVLRRGFGSEEHVQVSLAC